MARLVKQLRPIRSRTAAPASRYVTDPPSQRASGSGSGITLPFSVFDVPRLMSHIRAGTIDGIPPLDSPNDEELISTVIAHGHPRWSADQMRYHPGLRLHFYMFWMDVREAAKGNSESKGRVDGAIEAWAQLRKDEVISEIPNHTVGLWER
jgi:hypothetical protein